MNRTLLLGLAVLLGLAGIAISLVDMLKPEPPEPVVSIAVAKTNIPTYRLIQANMLDQREVKLSEARRLRAYEVREAIGMMTTQEVKPGTIIGRGEARPAQEVRFVEDLGLEVTSFSGRFDEMVGGQLRPGVLINIYGYRVGQGEEDPGYVTLVARDVRVVDVRSASGENTARPTPAAGGSGGGGGLLPSGAGFASRTEIPASVVTVAAKPEVVWHIIEALGAGNLEAWVTLAGRQSFEPTPTPGPMALVPPTYTPYPTYTPFPTPVSNAEAGIGPRGAAAELQTPTPAILPKTGGEEPAP